MGISFESRKDKRAKGRAGLRHSYAVPKMQWASTKEEITSQTDLYVVILSSKTYVFEDNLTKY